MNSSVAVLETYSDCNFDLNFHSALGTLLESGCSLRKLCLCRNGINDDAVATLANGFKSIAASLEVLDLFGGSISDEGLLAVYSSRTY